MENKINIACFKEGSRTAEVRGIWQWDYGQILRIQGLNLPSAVEIHFSLDEHGGEAVRRIGLTKDGVTDVPIPDSMVENESAYGDSYYFFVYIYLTDETSGNTEYKIRAKVSTRSKPEGYVSGGNDTFAEILKTVNEIAEEKVDVPVPAKVGQVLAVKSVDEEGKPTEFEAHPIEETDPTVPEWAKQPEKPTYTASEVGADAAGTAESKVSAHNVSDTAHNDIRLLVQGLAERLNTLADSDDETLDQMSEVVAYIKSNKNLIDAITTSKINVSDIIDNLTTNVSNKPLSSAQGVKLKALIDAIAVVELDESLTDNTKAAPAGMVGELKSDIDNIRNGFGFIDKAIQPDSISFLESNKLYNNSLISLNVTKNTQWCRTAINIDIKQTNGVSPLWFYFGETNSESETFAQIFMYKDGQTDYVKSDNIKQMNKWYKLDTNGEKINRIGIIFWASMQNTYVNDTTVYWKNTIITYESNNIQYKVDPNIKIDMSQVNDDISGHNVKVITVKKDGTGDYTSVVDACNATYPNLYSSIIYEIRISEGDYDIYSEWKDENKTGFMITGNNVGLNIGKNVKLIGIGARENTVLHCRQPEDSEYVVKGSCINMNFGGVLENLTIIAKNSRYTIHSDNSNYYHDNNYHIKDCTVIHEGNFGEALSKWNTVTEFGRGASSGDYVLIEGCKLVSPRDVIGMHNNTNFGTPSRTVIRECICETTGDTGVISYISSLGSGVRDKLEIHNCYLNGNIVLNNNGGSANTCDFDLFITGTSETEITGNKTGLVLYKA